MIDIADDPLAAKTTIGHDASALKGSIGGWPFHQKPQSRCKRKVDLLAAGRERLIGKRPCACRPSHKVCFFHFVVDSVATFEFINEATSGACYALRRRFRVLHRLVNKSTTDSLFYFSRFFPRY